MSVMYVINIMKLCLDLYSTFSKFHNTVVGSVLFSAEGVCGFEDDTII